MPSPFRLLVLSVLSGCASEVIEYGSGPEPARAGGSAATAGGGGSGGAGQGGATSKSSAGSGSGGQSGSGGKSGGGGSSSAGSGGKAGAADGGDGGSGDGAGASDGSAGGGDGGGSSGGGACDEASAELLSAMQSVITVDADACLKVEFNADQQAWVHSVTVQPSAGTYPFSFSWSNCGSEGSGAFGANYGNQVLSPVDPSCPVLIQLSGPGQTIELQWWAS